MHPDLTRHRSLPRSDKDVATCYRRANWARERMQDVDDPVLKQCLVAMERRWLSRVHGDEFLGRLTDITD